VDEDDVCVTAVRYFLPTEAAGRDWRQSWEKAHAALVVTEIPGRTVDELPSPAFVLWLSLERRTPDGVPRSLTPTGFTPR
jgi:hypothetical protein